MAKKMTKAEAKFWLWAVIIGLPLYGIFAVGEAIGWPWFIFGVVLAGGVYFWNVTLKEKARKAAYLRESEEQLRQQEARRAELVEQERARRDELRRKYGDDSVVNAIMRKAYWQGQTEEQLIDALGRPQDIDEKVLKTKRKEIWKYHSLGANRYALRVTLEQGLVVGWDDKR